MSAKRERLTWRDRVGVALGVIIFLLVMPFMLIAALFDDGMRKK